MKAIVALVFILSAVFLSTAQADQPLPESAKDAASDSIKNDWVDTETIVRFGRYSEDEKLQALRDFLKKHPGSDNPYREQAQKLIGELELGTFSDPEVTRRKTEWFSLRLVPLSNYGWGGGITAFTFRWNYVYWEILRFGFGGGLDGYFHPVGAWGSVGSSVGYPIRLDAAGINELRVGVVLQLGFVFPGNDPSGFIFPHSAITVPGFEISYVRHIRKNTALQAGLEVDIPVWYDTNHYPPPIIQLFFSLRI
ncbi:MAG: hypothetical protein WC889_06075 [Myxococcota bacterium]|jgi:hypothetical protein